MSKSSTPSRSDSPASQPEPSPVDTDSGEDPLTLDEVFGLLRNQRRRYVLRYFAARDRLVATLDDLAEHVAAQEFETAIHDLTSAERKRVYVSLYQCHLPRMDEAAVVAFDGDSKTVTLGPNAPDLFSHLPGVREAGNTPPVAKETGNTDIRVGRQYVAAFLCGVAVALALVELNAWSAGHLLGAVLTTVLAAVVAVSLKPFLSAPG